MAAAKATPTRDKTALVLAGGGILGAVYEIGALCAIDDMLVDRTVYDFDIFVGTSAGALVTSLLANRLSPLEIMQIVQNRHPEIGGFHIGDVFHANIADYAGRLLKLPRLLLRFGLHALSHRGDLAVMDLIWELTKILPSGLYDGSAIERYMRNVFEAPGRTNDFAALTRQLLIVATELDSGERVVFGPGINDDVPISRAVAASSAVPVLYRPVKIADRDYVDGGLYGAASLDLAIEAGAKLVICINPMVPFNASQACPDRNYFREHGLHAIVNQAVRTQLHSSLRYHIKNLKMKYPDVDIILIQPEWNDQRMFVHHPMYYGSRKHMADHGFRTVALGLLSDLEYYRRILRRHGIKLQTALISEELKTIAHRQRKRNVEDDVLASSPSTHVRHRGAVSFAGESAP
jgi:NTE family protein